MIAILLSMALSGVVTLLALPVATIASLLFFFWLQKVPGGVYLVQTITYTASDMAGLLAGAALLNSIGNIESFPWLFVATIGMSLKYASANQSFATAEAETMNRLQKGANIVGTIAAAIIASSIFTNW